MEKRQPSILTLSSSVATAATETRATTRIAFPFVLEEISIVVTSTLQSNVTFRVGFTSGGTGAIANDGGFRDLRHPWSDDEADRYPDQLIRLTPQKRYDSNDLRLKAEMINASGVTHDFFVIAVIREILSERKG